MIVSTFARHTVADDDDIRITRGGDSVRGRTATTLPDKLPHRVIHWFQGPTRGGAVQAGATPFAERACHYLLLARAPLQSCSLLCAATSFASSADRAAVVRPFAPAGQVAISASCSSSHLMAVSLRHSASLVEPILLNCNAVSQAIARSAA